MIEAEKFSQELREGPPSVRLTPRELRIIHAIENNFYMPLSDLASHLGCPDDIIYWTLSAIKKRLGLTERYPLGSLKRVVLEEISKRGYCLKEEPILTPNQLNILSMIARGKTHRQIAEIKGKKHRVVSNTVSEQILPRLKKSSSLGAVIEAIKRGLLDLDALTAGWDLSGYEKLTPRQQQVLSSLSEPDNDQLTLYDSLARKLGIKENVVKHQLSQICQTLKMYNSIEMAVGWLAFKKKFPETSVILP